MPSLEQLIESGRQGSQLGENSLSALLGSRSPAQDESQENTVHRRQAVIQSVQGPTCTIVLGSVIIPDVEYISWYSPVVGDSVFVEFSGSDPLVIGPIRGQGRRTTTSVQVVRTSIFSPGGPDTIVGPWTGATLDDYGMWDGANRFVIRPGQAGLWVFGANIPVTLPAIVASYMRLHIKRNTTGIMAYRDKDFPIGPGTRSLEIKTGPEPMVVGDFVELTAAQSGGASISGGFFINPFFYGYRLG